MGLILLPSFQINKLNLNYFSLWANLNDKWIDNSQRQKTNKQTKKNIRTTKIQTFLEELMDVLSTDTSLTISLFSEMVLW